jgi:hypothetical protein
MLGMELIATWVQELPEEHPGVQPGAGGDAVAFDAVAKETEMVGARIGFRWHRLH